MWHESIARILAWQPETLFLTHFGAVTHPTAHLAELLDRLDVMRQLARTLLDDETLSDNVREERFAEDLRRAFRQTMSEADMRRMELAVPFGMCWRGLARALRKAAGEK